MSITNPKFPDFNNFNTEGSTTQDFAIGGKLCQVSMTFQEFQMYEFEQKKDSIKHNLAIKLAEYMIDNKLIEFTKMQNMSMETTLYCRCYLAPDDQIRILRTLKAKP